MLILGDCEEKLKDIESNSVDMILTSPPYDNLRKYQALPFDKFQRISRECFRVLKCGSVMVWVVNDSVINGSESLTSFKQAIYFTEVGFKLHDTMIYEAEKPPLNHKRYEPKFEYMFVCLKGDSIRTFNPIKEPTKYAGTDKSGRRTHRGDGDKLSGWNGKNQVVLAEKVRGNIWRYSVGYGLSATDPIAHKHPAIFPEKLAEDHIMSWTNPGETVLDPFSGAGTTGVACKRLDRDYIGIELNPDYLSIAEKRINQTIRQISFDGA